MAPPTFVDGAPADFASVGTLTPLMVAFATNPSGGVDYWFLVCDGPPTSATNCWESGQQSENSWKVPSGHLQWDKQYYWQVFLINRVTTESSISPVRTFTTAVRDSKITSQLATRGVNGQEFHQLAGNYTAQFTDATVATAGPTMSVARWYNSLDPRTDGIFGSGWTARWDMKIAVEDSGASLLVTYPDGRQMRFGAKGDGSYEPPAGMYATLATVSGGGWRLMDKDATSYHFDSSGRLLRITDNRGRTQNLTYGGDGKLSTVTGVGGRKLTLTWNGNRVATISTDAVNGAPLTWAYTYTGDNLTKVCPPTSECTNYAYGTGSQYRTRVLDSDPVSYWRLNETSGTVAGDLGWAGNPATYTSATLAQAGALTGTPDTAVSMTAGHVRLPANTLARLSTSLSFEAWFKTTQNGVVLSAASTATSNVPRQPVIYVGNDGKLRAQYLERPDFGQPSPILPKITYTYDNLGRVQTVTGPEGGTVTYGWDQTGAQTSLIDESGTRYEQSYTVRGERATATIKAWTGSPVAPTPATDKVLLSYSYDPGGRLAGKVDVMGRKTGYTYFNDDKLSQVIGDDVKLNGSTTARDVVLESLTYDPTGNLTSAITGGGKTRMDFVRDAANRLTSETIDPVGLARKSTFTYDANGNVLRQTLSRTGDTRTETVEYAYNDDDVLIRETVENGADDLVTTGLVDDRGLVTAVTEPRGNATGADPADFTTNYRYDMVGRLVETKLPQVQIERNGTATPGRPTKKYGYNGAGQLTHSTDAEGRTVVTGYDKAGRTISITHPNYPQPGGSTLTSQDQYGYDAAGRVTQHISPLGNVTTAEYDQLDNLVRLTDPAPSGQTGGKWIAEYDLAGEQLAGVDPTGARVQATYDDLGRQITSTVMDRKPSTASFLTTFEYDDADNLIKEVEPGNRTTNYVVNAVGETTAETDPMTNVVTFDHDLAGRNVKVTSPLGNSTVSVYDLAGRLIESKDLDENGATLRTSDFGYDLADNLVSVTSPEGHLVQREYDASGMLTKLIEPVDASTSITTTFGYDAAGNQTRSTDGRGNTLVTTYNSLGLAESLIEPATAAYPATADRTWTNVYDAAGNEIANLQPGGVRIDSTYDHLERLIEESGTGAEAATADRTYGYDLAGRLTSIGDYALTYNDRGMLLTATRSGTQLASFSYDGLGNPLQRVDTSGTANFTWDNNDRLATAADPVSGRTFTYT